MNRTLPQTEDEYRAFLAARAADPVTAAQDAALLEYACTMPCPRKGKRRGDTTRRRIARDVRRIELAGGCVLYVTTVDLWQRRRATR